MSERPQVLRTDLVDRTWPPQQSSRCLSSLMPSTPSPFCYILRRGLITVGLLCSSTEPAPLFRFMFVFTFPDALPRLLSDQGRTQVIAPYLIIPRVAKRRALTSDSISGTTGSMRFRSQRSTDDDGEHPSSASGVNGETPSELITEDGNAIEEVPL